MTRPPETHDVIATADTQPSTTLLEPEIASAPGDGASWIEHLMRLLLILPAALLPWAMGGSDPLTRGLVVVVVAGVQLLAIPAIFLGSRHQHVFPSLMYPLLVGGLIGAVQLIPLPPGFGQTLSPQGSAIWTELSPPGFEPEIDEQPPSGPRWNPLSLYPASTRADLARYVGFVCLTLLGARLWWRAWAWKWLCVLVMTNGAAIAFFGMIQRLAYNGKLYFFIELTEGGQPFGPFINRNHAAGYLNLCLACALGAAVFAFEGLLADPAGARSGSSRGRRHRPHHHHRSASDAQGLLGLLSDMNFVRMLTVAGLLLLAAGVCASYSRGGMLAAMVAGTVVTLCVTRGRITPRVLALGTLAALLVVAFLAWNGFTESISERLEGGVSKDARLVVWPDFLSAAPDFWRTGSGFGTFRYIYQPYLQHPFNVWFYHAENQYIEALLEAGVGGLLCVLAALGLLGWASWKLLMRGEGTANVAFGIAGLYACISQAVCSFFDFSLYTAANAFLFSIIAGGVTARYFWSRAVTRRPEPPPVRWPQFVVPAGAAAAGLFALCWASMEVYRVGRLELCIQTADWDPDLDLSTLPLGYVEGLIPQMYVSLNPTVDPRVRQRVRGIPDDALGQSIIARVYIERYRLLTVLEQLKALPSDVTEESMLVQYQEFWKQSDVVRLHGEAVSCGADRTCLDEIRSRPLVVDSLGRARKRLLRSRRGSPLVAETHLLLGELAFLAPTPEPDEPHLARALKLAPSDADVLFRVGNLEFQAGRTAQADAHWRRSLELGSHKEGQILDLIGDRRPIAEVLEQVFPESPQALVKIGQTRFPRPEQAAERREFGRRARELLRLHPGRLPPGEAAHLQGAAAALEEDWPAALDALSRAIYLSPQDWKARVLQGRVALAAGKTAEAQAALDWCLLAHPQRREVRLLKAEIEKAKAQPPPSPDEPAPPPGAGGGEASPPP